MLLGGPTGRQSKPPLHWIVVVNSPTDRVVTLADIMARFRSGQIGAEPDSGESRLEFVGVHGDSVVVMGEETSDRARTRLMPAS